VGAARIRAPRVILGAVLALALASAGCSSGSAVLAVPSSSQPSRTASGVHLPTGKDGTVDRVVDGDTIIVDRVRVRLIGIDAPESVKPNSPVECYGPESSVELHRLLPAGTRVRLEPDLDRKDRYGRTLAYVWRLDPPLDVDVELARLGFARVLTIRPNVAHRAEIAAAVAAAKRAHRGLWRACG
jgi:micrococcal nuclease